MILTPNIRSDQHHTIGWRNKKLSSSRGRKLHFRGTTSIRCTNCANALLPGLVSALLKATQRYPVELIPEFYATRLRCNGLTRAGLLSTPVDFFGNEAGRPSAERCCGGFQPLASPSLPAWRPPTPPGQDVVVQLWTRLYPVSLLCQRRPGTYARRRVKPRARLRSPAPGASVHPPDPRPVHPPP